MTKNTIFVMAGSVARIGPKHVITDDPDITRRILAARSGYVRGPWFDSVRIDPHIPNIVSERDVKKHGKIRSKLAPSVSLDTVVVCIPSRVADITIDLVHRRLGASDGADRRSVGSRVDWQTEIPI